MPFHNLLDARRLSIRRPTIGRQLFVFVLPSEATDNQFGGQRSEGVVFAVHCSGIERRAAINCATDIRARVFDCVLVSRSRAERESICRATIKGNCVCGSLFRHRTADDDQLRDRLLSRRVRLRLSSKRFENQSFASERFTTQSKTSGRGIRNRTGTSR